MWRPCCTSWSGPWIASTLKQRETASSNNNWRGRSRSMRRRRPNDYILLLHTEYSHIHKYKIFDEQSTLYYIYRRVYGVYVDVDIIRYNIYRQCRYVMVIVSCRLPPGWLSYSFTQLHTSWPRSLVTNLATRVTSFRHELEKGNKVFLLKYLGFT